MNIQLIKFRAGCSSGGTSIENEEFFQNILFPILTTSFHFIDILQVTEEQKSESVW